MFMGIRAGIPNTAQQVGDLRSAVIAALFGGGEQGALYDPSDLSTLYQDSAGTTPVTADGDPVGRMEDLSGNGNHATQVDAASRPLYRTDGTLHWIESDGLDGSMDLPASILGLFRNVGYGAVASAGRTQNLDTSYQTIIHFSDGSKNVSSRLGDRYQHNSLDSLGAAARQTDGESITTAFAAADTDRHAIIAQARWAEGELDAYVDGTLVATSSFPASANTSDTDSLSAHLLYYGNPSAVGPMEACAVFARTGPMTSSQRGVLNQWLNSKAGL